MPSSRASSEPPAPEPPGRARWSGMIAGVALVLAAVAAYWNSLAVPFQFDDEPAIVYNPSIRTWATALQPPATGAGVTGRPVVNLSLAVNYALGGLEPRGYHAANLLLHALAALALWGVARRTLGFVTVGRGHRTPPSGALRRDTVIPPYNNSEVLAWGVALLWAVHPLLTESVVCVVQRNEILGGLFYLLTLYGFIRAEERPETGNLKPESVKRSWQALSVLACLLGMVSKEIVATAPLLVLLYDRTFVAGSFTEAWNRRKVYYGALAATWLPLAWLMLGNSQRAGTVGFGLGMSSWDYLLTQCHALTTYLKLAVWPHPLVVDYGMGINTLGDIWWRGLIVLGLLGATLWALVRRPVWGFVGAWFFVILAPSSSIVPLTTQTIAEHRMYLPLIAVLIAGGAGLQRLLAARALYIMLPLAFLLGLATRARNQDYASALTLWERTVLQAPANARAHLNFGQALFQTGRIPEAEAQFAEAVRLRPSYAEAHYNLGLTLSRRGAREEAAGHFETALKLAPDYAVAHNDLGIAYAEAGRMAEAQSQFEAAIAAQPDFGGAHLNLANLFMRTRRPGEAVPHFEAAVKLSPGVPEPRLSLALALAAAGRLRDAIPQLEEALRLRPDFAAARQYLAEMQADLQRLEAAKRP